MTLEEVKAFLAKVKYKPNWSFEARQFDDLCVVKVIMRVNDAYGVKQGELDIVSHFKFKLDAINSNALQTLLWNKIQFLETHEAKEWFLIDGERIYDPHKQFINDGDS